MQREQQNFKQSSYFCHCPPIVLFTPHHICVILEDISYLYSESSNGFLSHLEKNSVFIRCYRVTNHPKMYWLKITIYYVKGSGIGCIQMCGSYLRSFMWLQSNAARVGFIRFAEFMELDIQDDFFIYRSGDLAVMAKAAEGWLCSLPTCGFPFG